MSLLLFRPKPISHSLVIPTKLNTFVNKSLSIPYFSSQFFSTTATPYPLQYDMIISHPTQSQLAPTRRRPPPRLTRSKPENSTDPEEESSSELGFENWIDRKLATNQAHLDGDDAEMDKSKRKYYNKRRKRMYGTDSEDEDSRNGDELVELKPEVVELRTLHKREEELYFYDTFAYPWEKEKHYKMVYQLEKKYFPDHCLDKAFLEPGDTNSNADGNENVKEKVKKRMSDVRKEKSGEVEDDKGLVFFEEGKDERGLGLAKDVNMDVSEKKVEEFFKCLKKVPNKDVEVGNAEPYLVTRSSELPPRWDGPNGTVVLVNKPKGESLALFYS